MGLVRDKNEDDFYLEVAHALSGCQLVEQELKLYITEAFDLVRKCVGNKRLITTFKKLSDNDSLSTGLNKFKDERNFLSHQGIAHCLDYEGSLSESTALEVHPRLESIQAEAERLRMAIHEEANKFRGHLWFDPIEDPK